MDTAEARQRESGNPVDRAEIGRREHYFQLIASVKYHGANGAVGALKLTETECRNNSPGILSWLYNKSKTYVVKLKSETANGFAIAETTLVAMTFNNGKCNVVVGPKEITPVFMTDDPIVRLRISNEWVEGTDLVFFKKVVDLINATASIFNVRSAFLAAVSASQVINNVTTVATEVDSALAGNSSVEYPIEFDLTKGEMLIPLHRFRPTGGGDQLPLQVTIRTNRQDSVFFTATDRRDHPDAVKVWSTQVVQKDAAGRLVVAKTLGDLLDTADSKWVKLRDAANKNDWFRSCNAFQNWLVSEIRLSLTDRAVLQHLLMIDPTGSLMKAPGNASLLIEDSRSILGNGCLNSDLSNKLAKLGVWKIYEEQLSIQSDKMSREPKAQRVDHLKKAEDVLNDLAGWWQNPTAADRLSGVARVLSAKFTMTPEFYDPDGLAPGDVATRDKLIATLGNLSLKYLGCSYVNGDTAIHEVRRLAMTTDGRPVLFRFFLEFPLQNAGIHPARISALVLKRLDPADEADRSAVADVFFRNGSQISSTCNGRREDFRDFLDMNS